MKRLLSIAILLLAGLVAGQAQGDSEIQFRATSPYHNITVVDQNGLRVLSFDGTSETRLSLANPLQGHFEYTEYFHMAWLWNNQISNVLMIGLGGASVQRSFAHYYPDVRVESVEIDPVVVQVAREYFGFQETATQRVRTEDGRVFLRRTKATYDLIIADAYVKGRYGSSIPYHLATKEFFEMASEHLTTNGVMAYNVIGTMDGWKKDILGAMYKTMKSVFPNVYVFPATSSQNVVLIGTRDPVRINMVQVRQRTQSLVESGKVKLPDFEKRTRMLRLQTPSGTFQARVLTDDYAPIDGLLTKGR